MRSPAEIAAGMHEPRPFPNSTAWEIWAGNWCLRCEREDWENDTQFCPILSESIAQAKTPAEWLPGHTVDSSDEYVCVEFRADPRWDEEDEEERR